MPAGGGGAQQVVRYQIGYRIGSLNGAIDIYVCGRDCAVFSVTFAHRAQFDMHNIVGGIPDTGQREPSTQISFAVKPPLTLALPAVFDEFRACWQKKRAPY